MSALAGEAELIWCVPQEQVEAYRAAGAEHFEVGHPGQFEKMNEVLDRHRDEWVVFSDDDCIGINLLTEAGDLVPITLGEAAEEMIRVGEARRDHYVVVAQTTNKRFMSRSITSWGQTVNWLCAIAPYTSERFATTFAGDAVFAARIVDRYGRLARPNYIMAKYRSADPASHWLDGHQMDLEQRFGWIVKQYPHLYSGWKSNGALVCRPLPRYRG